MPTRFGTVFTLNPRSLSQRRCFGSFFPGPHSSRVFFSFSTFPAPFIFSKADQREFCGGVWNQTQCQQVAFSPSLLFSVLFRKTPVLLLNATVRVLSRNQCTSLNLLMLMFFLMSPSNSSLCPPFHHLSHLSNTGRWARGAKPRLNLLSEPRLILYSSPLK